MRRLTRQCRLCYPHCPASPFPLWVRIWSLFAFEHSSLSPSWMVEPMRLHRFLCFTSFPLLPCTPLSCWPLSNDDWRQRKRAADFLRQRRRSQRHPHPVTVGSKPLLSRSTKLSLEGLADAAKERKQNAYRRIKEMKKKELKRFIFEEELYLNDSMFLENESRKRQNPLYENCQ